MRRTTRFGQAEMGSEERKWGRQGGAESGPERLFRGGYRECKGTNHGQGDDEEGLSAGMGACETLTGEASRLKDETGQARASGEDEICDRRADRSGSAQFPTPRQNDDTASPPTKNKLRRRFLGSSGSPSLDCPQLPRPVPHGSPQHLPERPSPLQPPLPLSLSSSKTASGAVGGPQASASSAPAANLHRVCLFDFLLSETLHVHPPPSITPFLLSNCGFTLRPHPVNPEHSAILYEPSSTPDWVI